MTLDAKPSMGKPINTITDYYSLVINRDMSKMQMEMGLFR